jgi:hypothetical protein
MEEGEAARARALFEEALVLLREAGLVGLAARTGQGERAAQLLGAVDQLRADLRAVLDRVDGKVYAQSVVQAQALLDVSTFTRAWEAGQALSLAAAVAYALHNP